MNSSRWQVPFLRWFAGLLMVAGAAYVWVELESRADAQGRAVQRFGEVAVVAGRDAEPILGASTDEIWAYAWRDGNWSPVWIQVDERDEIDYFRAEENGVFDENDELVARFSDLGGEAPSDAWPDGVAPEVAAIEIMVTDPLLSFPLEPGAASWLYLFVTPRPEDHELGEAVMRHDVPAGFLGSPDYDMVFASARDDGFIGPKELRAFGSTTNIIDRFKIRMTLVVLFGLSRQEVNEEDIAAQSGSLGLTDPPRRLGPLRVVLDDQGFNIAYPSRVTLFRGAFDESDLPLGVDGIDAVRLSLDLSPGAIGDLYHDSNLAAEGVPIDGVPDSVPERPIPDWRWIELPGGKLIFLPRPGASDSKATNLYRDGGAPEEGDTGDGRHVGEVGVQSDDVDAFVEADFPGEMIFAPDALEVDVMQLVAESKAPLEVSVQRWGEAPATVTPTEAATSIATEGSTSTPSRGATPTNPTPGGPSPSATPTEGVATAERYRAYLPLLRRD